MTGKATDVRILVGAVAVLISAVNVAFLAWNAAATRRHDRDMASSARAQSRIERTYEEVAVMKHHVASVADHGRGPSLDLYLERHLGHPRKDQDLWQSSGDGQILGVTHQGSIAPARSLPEAALAQTPLPWHRGFGP